MKTTPKNCPEYEILHCVVDFFTNVFSYLQMFLDNGMGCDICKANMFLSEMDSVSLP